MRPGRRAPDQRESILTSAAPPTVPSRLVHLSVALNDAGWHPAAWREPRARPADLLTGRHWVDLIQEAERGLLDFVTIEDGLSLQSGRFGRPARC